MRLLSLAVGIQAAIIPSLLQQDGWWMKHEAAAVSASDPPRPTIPPAFTSSVLFLPLSVLSPGVMYYDLKARHYNISVRETMPLSNFTTSMKEIALNTSYYLSLNDRCQPIEDAMFGDLFSWTKVAAYEGQKTLGPKYRNRTCDQWGFNASSVNLTLCTQDNTPVLLVLTQPDPTESFSIYFDTDFFAGTPPASLFVPPPNCYVPDPPCDGGASTQLDAFIFHPEHVFDINNENVADLLGDVVFICSDSLSNHSLIDQFQWVSRYNLQVWSGWGQYAECNRPSPKDPGTCIGLEKFLVGREAAFGMKEKCGQCADNSDVGSWYSLPTAGMCNSTSQPLGPNATLGQCTWRILEKKKTIDGKCLLQANNMLQVCLQEAAYPFAKSAAIMMAAFESTDPSQGGCPPVGP